MTKHSRLVDFQLSVATGESMELEKEANELLFASFEPVRLWLKERTLRAPFRKISILFSGPQEDDGFVANAGGICHVMLTASCADVLAKARTPAWAFSKMRFALDAIHRQLRWSDPDLVDFVVATAMTSFPLRHEFVRLAIETGRARCVPWLSTEPGSTTIGVRVIEDADVKDVAIAQRNGPLYLEDDFPFAEAKLVGDSFALLDQKGRELGRAILPHVIGEPL